MSVFQRSTLEEILGFCGEVKGKAFLDIGCNKGFYCFELAKRGAKVIGVELLSDIIEECRRLAKLNGFPENNPLFVQSDALDYEIPKVDYVLLLNVFHYLVTEDEERGWTLFNTLLNKSQALFYMSDGYYLNWFLSDTNEGIGDAILKASDAAWYKLLDAGSSSRRALYVFTKT